MTPTSTDATEALTLAVAHHGAGHLAEAEVLYRRVLAVEPEHPRALYLLAAIAQQVGRLDVAVDLNTRVLAIRPDLAEAHNNLGRCYHDTGRLDQAVASYRAALAHKPEFTLAIINMGDALREMGRLDDAIGLYRRAILCEPGNADAHNSLGLALLDLGKVDDAAAGFRTAVALQPDFGVAHLNLGNALQQRGDYAAAIVGYDRVIALDPTDADAHNNRGLALHEAGRFEEAVASYRAALAHRPEFAIAHTNLGNTLKVLGQAWGEAAHLDAAAGCYREALRIRPGDAAAHNGLGSVFSVLGRTALGIDHFRKAVAAEPELADAHMNLGLALLVQGELGNAWQEYAWRFQSSTDCGRRPFPQPRWEGQPLGEKTLLIWGEQGLADEIMGLTMLPDAMARAGHCVVECDRRLVDLVTRTVPAATVVPRETPPSPRALHAHRQIPMMSLAQHFRNEPGEFPGQPVLLSPDPVRAAHWKGWLDGLGPGFKIGVSWRGRLLSARRSRFFAPIDRLGPIFRIPGVVFVTLQYDESAEDIATIRALTGVTVHSPEDLDLTDDLDGVAALMAGLDAVVGPATAVGNLAGAVGRPTWAYAYYPVSAETLICGMDHVPWHPSVRLETCGFGEDWDGVVGRVAGSLNDFLAQATPGGG